MPTARTIPWILSHRRSSKASNSVNHSLDYSPTVAAAKPQIRHKSGSAKPAFIPLVFFARELTIIIRSTCTPKPPNVYICTYSEPEKFRRFFPPRRAQFCVSIIAGSFGLRNAPARAVTISVSPLRADVSQQSGDAPRREVQANAAPRG